jgi:hypothetical protein
VESNLGSLRYIKQKITEYKWNKSLSEQYRLNKKITEYKWNKSLSEQYRLNITFNILQKNKVNIH